MALTDSIADVGEYVFNLIEANESSLGLAKTYYGDQEKVPVTPVAIVETGDKLRELNGVPRRTKVTMTLYLMIYHSKVQDTQISRREVEALAEAVELLLHADRTLGGLVIHCMVTTIEPGYATRDRTMLRASRLTFEATSQIMLPYP
jgi:hypothetical protein